MDFKNSFLFRGIDADYMAEFLASAELMSLAKGNYLFRQNELGDAMYIVHSGSLEVVLEKDSHKKAQVLGVLQAGAVLGELCVFGQQKRTASILALEDAQLYKIEGEAFRARIYNKDLDALLICYNLAKLLSERLTQADVMLVSVALAK